MFLGLDAAHFLPQYLLFQQNFLQPIAHFFPESWALAIEFWFYLVIALTFFLTRKRSLAGRLLVPALVFIVLAFLARLLLLGTQYESLVICRLDTPFIGVAAAYFRLSFARFDSYQRKLMGVVAAILIAFIWIAFAADYFHRSHPSSAFFYGLMGLPSVPLIFFLEGVSFKKGRDMIVAFAKRTYALYLIQLPIIYCLRIFRVPIYVSPVVTFGIYAMMSFLAADVIYRCYERKF